MVYCALALLVFREGWSSPTSANIGGPGDPIVGMWAFRWTPFALSHGEGLLVTDFLNYPFGVNLMWNSPLVLHSLLLWPITATAGPVVAYNVFVTLNVAFSAWCAYFTFRTFVNNHLASFAGGLVYGFSAYMMAQSRDHPTLTSAYIPPLLLIVFYEIAVRQKRSPIKMGAVLGLLAACQLFIAEELLASEAIAVALGLLILAALNPRAVAARLRHLATALGTGLATFLVLTLWALRLQFFGPRRITGGTVQRPGVFVSDLANFVVPTEVTQLAPDWAVDMSHRWSGNLSEWNAFVGVPLLLLVLFVAVRYWSRPVVRVASLLALAMAVLSLGPSLHLNGDDTGFPLPWQAFEVLPLIGHVLPVRLMLFVFLMLGLLVAVFVERLLVTQNRWSMAIGGVAMAAVGATLLPTLSYGTNPIDVPSFFTDGSAKIIPEGSVALIAPFQQLYPAEPMLWQAETGMRFRIPQGYFIGPTPAGKPAYGAPPSHMSSAMYRVQAGRDVVLDTNLRQAIAQDLADREVKTVIVGPMRHQDKMVRLFRGLFNRPPQQFGGVYVWQQVPTLIKPGR